MSTRTEPNRLAGETSPYLQQHASNPVDWYPWGREALERSRSEDRPILLSVGYSACHWCHVMERESFEDDGIAALMNELFVNIKVDREERPDLDELYMSAVQAITGSGGWPMTVFLTPQLRPFYGGTYYPPVDRQGHPGFTTVLRAVAGHFRAQRDKIEEQADRLMSVLRQQSEVLVQENGAAGAVDETPLRESFDQHSQIFDTTFGGFGSAPKFPHSMGLAYLLRYHRRSGSEEALRMVELTLQRMARGGIYDQLGGGFHRYSVDERWLVPHFEKMLYDNALLTWVFIEAFQATGNAMFRNVVEETLAYVLREMSLPAGGYCATQDADSEGEEGRFFVWRAEEVARLLAPEQAELFCRYYDITLEGNFEGSNIPHVDTEMPELAAVVGVELAQLEAAVATGKETLFRAREQRIRPARDDKLVASWNGLMITAMARAYSVFGDLRYLESASEAATFILDRMISSSGELMHSFKDGVAKQPGFQDDYACVINGLVDLYEASFEPRWLRASIDITAQMMTRFWDVESGGFFYTEAAAEDLILRTKNPFDNATPSGNSMAVLALLRLSALTDDNSMKEKALTTIALFADLLRRAPTSCAQMACALDFALEGPLEVAIVGEESHRESLRASVFESFLPTKVVCGWPPRNGDHAGGEEAQRLIPLLAGKQPAAAGSSVAYVCRNMVCQPPVGDPEALREHLLPLQTGSYLRG